MTHPDPERPTPDRSRYYMGTRINARHAGRCTRCDAEIFRGEAVLYVPAKRATLCRRCAP